MTVIDGVLCAKPGVNIGDLHPVAHERVLALQAKLPGLMVLDAARKLGEPGDYKRGVWSSWYAWERWQAKAPGATMAADPRRLWGGVGPGRGSKHNTQPAASPVNTAGAIDLRLPADGSITWADVHVAGPALGLFFPLLDKRKFGRWVEPWHCTIWLGNDPADIAAPKPVKRAPRPPRGGYRAGDPALRLQLPSQADMVRWAQETMGKVVADGIIGPKTRGRAKQCASAARLIAQLDKEKR